MDPRNYSSLLPHAVVALLVDSWKHPHNVFTFLSFSLSLSASVCVWKRERKRERERVDKVEKTWILMFPFTSIRWLRLCEREQERRYLTGLKKSRISLKSFASKFWGHFSMFGSCTTCKLNMVFLYQEKVMTIFLTMSDDKKIYSLIDPRIIDRPTKSNYFAENGHHLRKMDIMNRVSQKFGYWNIVWKEGQPNCVTFLKISI